jgi:undecaprenyl-phosphate galactose phosphotransferase
MVISGRNITTNLVELFMAQSTLKFQEVGKNPQAGSTVEQTVEQVVALAREARYDAPAAETRYEIPRTIPNFTRRFQLSGRLFLANDAAALVLSFIIGGLAAWAIDIYLVGTDFQKLIQLYTLRQFAIFSGPASVALLWLDTKGHYRQRLPYWESIGHIVTVALCGFIASGFIQFAVKDPSSRLWMGISWVLFGIFLLASRIFVRRGLDRNGEWQIPALMIGKGPTAKAALEALSRDRAMGFNIVDTISPVMLNNLGRPQAWKQLLATHDACQVFLALEGGEIEAHQMALKSLVRARVPCSIVPPWLGLPSSTLSPHHFMMQDVLLLHDTNRLDLPLPRLLKRSFDFTAAALALVALAPIFAMLAFIVRLDGGPAFFSQPRVGRHGKLFNCYKFRSMRIDAERTLTRYLAENPEAAIEWQRFQKLQNDVRVTRVGQFIRHTSLDELPQLLNVLKGDMSLVGPRPIMQGQEDFYAEDFSFYATVRPGITGPWQVSGRNKLTFKERVALESWYARNWSLWMDIVILLKTIPTLIRKGQAF